jgi:hypothetical protein
MQPNKVSILSIMYRPKRMTTMEIEVNGKDILVVVQYCRHEAFSHCVANRILSSMYDMVTGDQRTAEFEDARDDMLALLLCADEAFWTRHAPPREGPDVYGPITRGPNVHIFRDEFRTDGGLSEREMEIIIVLDANPTAYTAEEVVIAWPPEVD